MYPVVNPSKVLLSVSSGLVVGVLSMSSASVFAQSNVTLFGAVDVGVRHVSNSEGGLASVNSGNNSTSRLGLRGDEDLGGGMKASFWLETTVAADTGAAGTGSTFWDRRSTLSLSGPFGEVRLGRDYTPMFRAYAGADVFGYVGAAGMGTLYNASASNVVSRAFGTGTTSLARTNNAIQYYTPDSLGGFYANLMLSDRESGAAAGDFDFSGVRLGYADKSTDVSVYNGSTNIVSTDQNFKLQGVVGSTKWDKFKFTAGLAQMKYLNAKQSNLTLGVEWDVGPGSVRAIYHRMDQSGYAANNTSVAANDAQALGLGYVHNLSKRTALYGTAMFVSNSGGAKFVVPGGKTGIDGGSSSSGYDFGVRHLF
jgi:predicted porin